MSEKRFIKKDYGYDGCFFFDREQEFTDNVNKIPFYDVETLIPMTDEQVVELLNELDDERMMCKALKKFIKDNFNEMMDSKMVIVDE